MQGKKEIRKWKCNTARFYENIQSGSFYFTLLYKNIFLQDSFSIEKDNNLLKLIPLVYKQMPALLKVVPISHQSSIPQLIPSEFKTNVPL